MVHVTLPCSTYYYIHTRFLNIGARREESEEEERREMEEEGEEGGRRNKHKWIGWREIQSEEGRLRGMKMRGEG